MTPPLVQAYEGSSVADLAKLERVARRAQLAHQSESSLVVVVGAMSQPAGDLLALAERAKQASGGKQIPERELDMLCTAGQRVTTALLSILLNGLGVPATSLTGSQSGIITSNRHRAADIVQVRPHRVQRVLDEGSVAVVAGLQGVSEAGEVTALPHSGASATAVALAAGLGASRCELYADSAGLYSANPDRIASAFHLPKMTYAFAREMVRAGASGLSDLTLTLAERYGIELVIRHCAHRASSVETSIAARRSAALRAVTVEAGLVWNDTLNQSRAVQEWLETQGIALHDATEATNGAAGWLPKRALRIGELAQLCARCGAPPPRLESIVSLLDSSGRLDAELRAGALASIDGAYRVLASNPLRLSVAVGTHLGHRVAERWHQDTVTRRLRAIA